MNQPAAGLREGTADVAFVRPPFTDDGISMVTVLTEERYIAMRADHPLAGRGVPRRQAAAHGNADHVDGGGVRGRRRLPAGAELTRIAIDIGAR